MIKIERLANTGKTQKLLEECSKNNGIFVCKNEIHAIDKCGMYEIAPISMTIMNYEDYIACVMGSVFDENDKIYIDELGDLIKEALTDSSVISEIIFSLPNIAGYTITLDDNII